MLEFASGKINVLEKRMLDKNDLERMLKAPDYKNAFLALYDTDLGDVIEEGISIERAFEKDFIIFKKNLSDILKDECKELLWFLFLKFDALNLKIALKESEGLESFPFSIESYQKIEKFVKDPKIRLPGTINLFVKEMIDEALSQIKKYQNPSPDVIENVVDLGYFKAKLSLSSFSPFLKHITKIEIDIANMKNLVSKKRSNLVIDGGNLDKEEIKKILQLREGEVIRGTENFFEIFSLSFLAERFKKEKKESVFEHDLISFFSNIVFDKERETGCGVEKVMAFFLRKINSQANIRLILFSKRNNISVSEIEKSILPI